MAKRIIETLIDDITGGEAHGTVRFAIDGDAYEIDLHQDRETQLREALAPFIVKARPVRASQASQPRRLTNGSRAMSRERSMRIREWAKDHGIKVSDRGRIAEEVVRQFEATS